MGECPKHSQILWNPYRNPKISGQKIIRERLIRVPRCYLCFVFFDLWPSPKADGHYMLSHWNPFPPLTSCPQPSAWTNQRKNTDITDFTRIGLHGFFFLWYYFANESSIRFGFCRIWSTMVLAASRRHQPMISANEHQPPLVLPRRGDAGYSVCRRTVDVLVYQSLPYGGG